MSNKPVIALEGLSKFRKGLRAMDRELPKRMRLVLKQAVSEAADDAEVRYSRWYRSRTGKTKRTIRAQATQTSAGVAFGGARYPWVPGQEFGSNKRAQFSPWTGKGPGGAGSAGRAIFPAVRAQAEPVARALIDGLDELARSTGAFPEQL